MEYSADTKVPVFALELLLVSLDDMRASGDTAMCDCVLKALRVHQTGMFHGDMDPQHAAFSSQSSSIQPRWVDVSHARHSESSKKLKGEFVECHEMLQSLQKCARQDEKRNL